MEELLHLLNYLLLDVEFVSNERVFLVIDFVQEDRGIGETRVLEEG